MTKIFISATFQPCLLSIEDSPPPSSSPLLRALWASSCSPYLDFGSTYETFEVQELSHLLKVKKQPNCPPPPIAVLLTNATLYLVNYLVGHFNHFEFRAQNLSDCAITVMYFTLVFNFVKNIQGDYIYFKNICKKGRFYVPYILSPDHPLVQYFKYVM